MARYTNRQYLTMFVICVAQFCNALCISIQAPFYPAEAERKGATPTQYGFVFGIYELVIFICCPIYGKFLGTLGVKFVNNTGIFIVSVTCTLFGFLGKIQDPTTFIAFSFVIRVMEATGTSAFTTAAFSIIAQEFPDAVGSTFATLETFFGIGLILGPTIGGALFEVGGFILPFVTVGSLLMISGILIYFLLPSQSDPIESIHGRGIFFLLSKVQFIMGTVTVIATAYSIGFVQAILEPHIRNLGLNPLQIGLLFIINGTTYAISAPIWGRLCDRVLSPKFINSIGSGLIVLAFIFLGPAPFLPLRNSLPVIISSLVLHGLGMGAALVASFSGFHKDALSLGFPDSISTYGIVSGLWTSMFALGAFIGPSSAGVLFDLVGFPWASQTVVAGHMLLLLSYLVYICYSKRQKFVKNKERDLLISGKSSIESSSYGTVT